MDLKRINYSIILTPDFTEALSKAPALWILKTRELHRIPGFTMNAIIVHVHSLFDVAMSEVCDRSLKKLQDISALLQKVHLLFHGLDKVSFTATLLLNQIWSVVSIRYK